MSFINDFIDRINAIDTNEFFRHYVPLFIGLGIVILIATFLGPLGILMILGVIAAIVYFIYQSVK